MTHDPFKERVLNAAKPPSDDWWAAEPSLVGIYELLIGAAAAILESRQIFDQLDSFAETPRTPEELFQEFSQAALTSDRGFNWRRSGHLSRWSAGFFMIKAMTNLAFVFDRTINTWLVTRMKVSDQDTKAYDPIIGSWINGRLWMLGKGLGMSAPESIDAARGGLENYLDTEKSREYLKTLVKSLEPRYLEAQRRGAKWRVEDFFETIKETSGADCACIVFSRVNALKHRTTRVWDRFGILHPLELAVTTKAFIFLAAFWRSMVDDTKDSFMASRKGK